MTPHEAAATVREALGDALVDVGYHEYVEMDVRAALAALDVLVAAAERADTLAEQHDQDTQSIIRQVEVFRETRDQAEVWKSLYEQSVTDRVNLKKRANKLAEALTMMVESYERHDEWCGNLATAPGASIHWQAINSARAALAADSRPQGADGDTA